MNTEIILNSKLIKGALILLLLAAIPYILYALSFLIGMLIFFIMA